MILWSKTHLDAIDLQARFGEEQHCFFADKNGKFLWFYGPIAIMLALNLAGCAVIIKTLCKMKKQKRDLGIGDEENQGGSLKQQLSLFDLMAHAMRP